MGAGVPVGVQMSEGSGQPKRADLRAFESGLRDCAPWRAKCEIWAFLRALRGR